MTLKRGNNSEKSDFSFFASGRNDNKVFTVCQCDFKGSHVLKYVYSNFLRFWVHLWHFMTCCSTHEISIERTALITVRLHVFLKQQFRQFRTREKRNQVFFKRKEFPFLIVVYLMRLSFGKKTVL